MTLHTALLGPSKGVLTLAGIWNGAYGEPEHVQSAHDGLIAGQQAGAPTLNQHKSLMTEHELNPTRGELTVGEKNVR